MLLRKQLEQMIHKTDIKECAQKYLIDISYAIDQFEKIIETSI